MNSRHLNSSSRPHGAGFSMIDVLVAIIVLATALLALASLQGALTRNAADSRARSQIAAYSEGLVNQLRSTGYSGIAANTTVSPSNGSAATTMQRQAYAAQQAAGVSNLQTSITSTTYYGLGTTFVTSATTTGAEYKQVKVQTTWTDASGQSRKVSFDTIVDSTQTNQTDQTLVNRSLSLTGASGPIVREYNPGATAGVIPIAVGSSTDTAATNPKPTIISANGKNSDVAGTTFNVLTYQSPDANNETVIRQRVETRVIMCSCKYNSGQDPVLKGTVFQQPYRPTYWDTTKYVEPDPAAGTYSTTGIDTNVTQDDYCDICCRDRNDSSGDKIKFDPFTTDYNHYRYDSTGALAVVGPSDTTNDYQNACRLIRVNGQYRVATDLRNYFFGLLGTDTAANSGVPSGSTSTQVASSPIPAGNYVTKYQSFVTQYLTDSITSLAAGTGPKSTSYAAGIYGDSTHNLNDPGNISISYDASVPDFRYLHARGLYVDYLEPDALGYINDAITTCPTTSTTADCVLPLLPFTTINETELAHWTVGGGSTTTPQTASSNNDASVTNNALTTTFGNPDAPQRGVVLAQAGANEDDTANVWAQINDSNSGLTATPTAEYVDPDDAASTSLLNDAQLFTISSTNSSNNTIGATVTLSGPLPQLDKGYNGSYPSMSWDLSATSAPCNPVTTGNGGNHQLFDYQCNPIIGTSPKIVSVSVQNYNQAYTKSGTDPCTGKGNVTQQWCKDFAVDSTAITLNGSAITPTSVTLIGTDGNLSEGSTITLPQSNVNSGNNNTIGIGFILQSDTATSYTCSTNNKPTYDPCP